MAQNKTKAVGKVAETAKESARMRAQRIDGSQNGATMRTRVVRDKTKYRRNLKHKKSLAEAGDFPFSSFFLFGSFNICSDFILLGGGPQGFCRGLEMVGHFLPEISGFPLENL